MLTMKFVSKEVTLPGHTLFFDAARNSYFRATMDEVRAWFNVNQIDVEMNATLGSPNECPVVVLEYNPVQEDLHTYEKELNEKLESRGIMWAKDVIHKLYEQLGLNYEKEERWMNDCGWMISADSIPSSVYRIRRCGNRVRDLEDKIKDVIFNDPATIVLWKDGTKTVVKCGPDDKYDPEKGLALCMLKKQCGNKGNYNNLFRKYLPKEED